MFQFAGEIERFVADLYPYRVPLTIGLLIVLAGVLSLAWRSGWVAAASRGVRRYPLQSAAAVIVVLAVMLPVGWYLLSPLWTRTELIEASPLVANPPPATATAATTEATATPSTTASSDSMPQSTETESPFTPREVLRGTWEGADSFHFAEGDALIIEVAPGEYVLRVENFSVQNGPDLFMMLSPDPDGYAEGVLNLGELRATDGAFNYDIPAGTDLSEFQSVIVWCEDFAVLFATAPLAEV